MRDRYEELPDWEKRRWEQMALNSFYAAGHSYAEECPPEDKQRDIERRGKIVWQEAHRNWLERWSNGWYGMTWRDHKSMLRNNYLGHRNSQTYVGGPKFYIPPRRGPWLSFLRWLQVVPPRPMTIGDRVKILNEEPFE